MAQPEIKGRTGLINFWTYERLNVKAYYSLIHFLHRLALEIFISVTDAEQLKVAEKYVIVGYCLKLIMLFWARGKCLLDRTFHETLKRIIGTYLLLESLEPLMTGNGESRFRIKSEIRKKKEQGNFSLRSSDSTLPERKRRGVQFRKIIGFLYHMLHLELDYQVMWRTKYWHSFSCSRLDLTGPSKCCSRSVLSLEQA